MKNTLKFRSLVAFGFALLFLVANAFAIVIEEFTKEWSKSYDVAQDATVELNNKYGQIHITTWDQDKVDIKARAVVDVQDSEKAENLLKDIRVEFKQENGRVKAETHIDCKLTGNTCKKLKIDYDVRMPRKNNLVVINKFGDVFVNELEGTANMKVSYGKLNAGKLLNKANTLKVSYGGCTVDELNKASVEMKYSDVHIKRAAKVTGESKYSSITLDDVDKVVMNSGYDKELYVIKCKEARLDAKFSQVRIDHVSDYFNLEANYGNCVVKRIVKGFDEVVIDCKFGNTELYFDDDASFQFEASCSFSDVDLPSTATINNEVRGTTSYSVDGVVGKEANPTSKVKVNECKYGSVKVKFN